MAFGKSVVDRQKTQKLGGVGEVPAHAFVARHAINQNERAIFDLGFDRAVEELDQVGVGKPHLACPIVRQSFGAVCPA